MERGRFAPSPTGLLHLGSARTALAAWLAAHNAGGSMVVRVEDLDRARTVPGAERAILEDLAWLGLAWTEGPDASGPNAPYRQSERLALYDEAMNLLRAHGVVYPCSCSRRDVELAAQAPHNAEPVYPGLCRTRDPQETLAIAKQRGRQVSWRLRVEEGIVRFHDGVAGACEQNVAREVGDFVLLRSDGVPAYQLAVVVDDVLMDITQVVRGDDLLSSTARQVLLWSHFGARPPSFLHVPLVLGDDGARLAKRHGAIAIAALRDRGATAERVRRALLASLGCSDDLPRAVLDPTRIPRDALALEALRADLPELR